MGGVIIPDIARDPDVQFDLVSPTSSSTFLVVRHVVRFGLSRWSRRPVRSGSNSLSCADPRGITEHPLTRLVVQIPGKGTQGMAGMTSDYKVHRLIFRHLAPKEISLCTLGGDINLLLLGIRPLVHGVQFDPV